MPPYRFQQAAPHAGQRRQQTPTLGGQSNVVFAAGGGAGGGAGGVAGGGKQMNTQHLQDGVDVGCHVDFLHRQRGQQRSLVGALQQEREQERRREQSRKNGQLAPKNKQTTNHQPPPTTPHLFDARPPSCAANTSGPW